GRRAPGLRRMAERGAPGAVASAWLSAREGERGRGEPSMIDLRDFRPGDEAALRAVFESAIHEVAIRDYTRAQVDAWAPRVHDTQAWAVRMRALQPFVAI